MSKFTFISFLLLLSVFSGAQNTEIYLDCAFDSLHLIKIQDDRSYSEKIFKSERRYVNYLANASEYQANSFTLPVAFHIIHQNGAENISDTQVRAALDHLNESFANSGFYDPATGVNTDVQFCLAKRDPDGNLTNGITRTFSSFTNIDADIDDGRLKDLSRWDPTSYINIWVVNEICRGSSCSVAGYAYLPAAHGRDFDGIVLEADYVGRSRSKTTVLTHEMGHYLGLYHTFDGGCTNNDCQQDGDKVCDTPPDNTTAYTACSGSMNSCDSDEDDSSVNNPFRSPSLGGLGDQDDLIANYMDYSQLSCYNLFTQGQKDRMHFFINTTRRSLLNSLACETPCTDIVQAAFSVTDTEIALGTSLSFLNNSVNAEKSRWYINDSLFSSTRNPAYTFDQEGYYTIILEAISSDTIRCSNDYDTIEIIVTCPTNSDFKITTNKLTVNAQNNSQNHNSSHWSLRDQNGQELFTANTEDFSHELTVGGWYQLCLLVKGDKCNDEFCKYFFLKGESSANKCTDIKNIIFTNAQYSYIQVIKSKDESIYLTGVRGNEYFISKFTTDGEEIWSRTLPHHQNSSGKRIPYSVYEDSDGYLLITGVIGSRDGILIKFDPFNITTIWSTLIEDSKTLGFSTIESDDGLSYVLTGQNHGCDEATLLIVNKTSGSIYDHYGYELGECTTFTDGIQDGTSVIVTGRYSLGFGFDTYRPGVTKLDYSGNILWSYTYLKESNANAMLYSHGICKAPDGFLIVGHGDFNGTNRNNHKGLIIKINSTGEMQWSNTIDINSNATFQRYFQAIPHSFGYYLIGEYANQTNNTSDIVLININSRGDVNWTRSLDYELSNEKSLHNSNGVLLANDTLLLVITSDNDVTWLKMPSDGQFDPNCDLISEISVNVNSLNNFRIPHSFDIAERNFSTSNDNALAENITLDKNFVCGFPDITLRIDSSWCTSTPGFIAKAQIEVCNSGITSYAGAIPLSIYDNNPTRTNAQLVLKDTLNVNLDVGECQSFSFPVLPRNRTTGTFFIVINDDNSITPIYDLNEDFPVTTINECFFKNNLDSFSFFYSPKSIDLGPDVSTCDNNPVTFNAGSGFSVYRWNDASTDSTLTTSRDGTYWVTAEDECGITYSDTIQLTYKLPTKVQVGNDTILCFGDSITLNSTNTFMNYSWFPEEVFPCPSCPTVTLAPESSMTVILTAETDQGCFSSDSIRIEVTIPFRINDSVSICKGDTISYYGLSITDTGRYSITIGQCDTIVDLYAQYEKSLYKEIDLGQDIFSCDDTTVTFNAPSGFESYQWNTNSSDSFITTSQAGEYWIFAQDACGVTYSDTVKLRYQSAQKIDLEDQRTLCFGESLDLNAPIGYSTYNWSPAELFDCNTCQNTSITPDSTVKAYLFAITDSGCVSSDSVIIKVNYEHKIHDTLSFCKGDSIYYQNRFLDEPGIYQFTMGSFCDTTLVLQLFETDLSPVLSNVDLSFTNGLQNLSGLAYEINLNLDPDEWMVQWLPSVYFLCDTCLSTTIRPFEEEIILSVLLTHRSGCVYYKEFPVNWLEQHNIYIPNIFTPNGDGINDSWNIFTTNTVDKILSLQIYDRWGNLIKEWKDRNDIKWDGRFKGKEMNSSVLIYTIEYRTVYGNTIRTSGDFTLLR